MLVPVMESDGKTPLMPTKKHRAMRLIERGDATPFWRKGVWCIRLNREPSAHNLQTIIVGVDPGSKREGYSVVSEAHTIANVQADAVTHVKDAVEARRNARRTRRTRNKPHRACRSNRGALRRKENGWLPPSTRARWEWKLRNIRFLARLYPITDVVVEDIKARTRKGRGGNWNGSFSPLEVGKQWFYVQVQKDFRLFLRQGWETAEIRKTMGLRKSSDKMLERWDAHCVDAWAIANDALGQPHAAPGDTSMLVTTSLKFSRRQLHRFQPARGGERRPYGSTRSLGFKRGSIVRHPRWGVCLVGGTSKGRISLHSQETNKRLCQNAKIGDIMFLAYNDRSQRYHPAVKAGVSTLGIL